MSESKRENLLLVLIAIFLTNIFSVLFQINLTLAILFNLICVSIFLIIYIFEYPLRKQLVIRFRNPLKRVIIDLELYHKIKEDPKLEKKVINKLYKNFKLSELLEGPFRITTMDSIQKSFFKFQKEGENPLITIYFWKSSSNSPYQFQISSKRYNTSYESIKMSNPDQDPEIKRDNLKKLIVILREFLELK